MCSERLDEAQHLFADLAHRLQKLYTGYSDDELAAALRFTRDATAAQRAATDQLTHPDE
jgi:hypothetical protein